MDGSAIKQAGITAEQVGDLRQLLAPLAERAATIWGRCGACQVTIEAERVQAYVRGPWGASGQSVFGEGETPAEAIAAAARALDALEAKTAETIRLNNLTLGLAS
jgi:aerobic-type carbon monoxide dehydrogenase small subunit (CoxS/CutS family)